MLTKNYIENTVRAIEYYRKIFQENKIQIGAYIVGRNSNKTKISPNIFRLHIRLLINETTHFDSFLWGKFYMRIMFLKSWSWSVLFLKIEILIKKLQFN